MDRLLCPVRACGLALTEEGRRYVCARSHSFDLARSGYLNLLQPQDRRSKEPGDSADAVAARRRLHDRSISAPLRDAIWRMASPQGSDIILDAGCGEGYHLGSSAPGAERYGVDISPPAIEAAAKKYPDCHWIIANADRQIPLQTGAMDLVVSITARMNEPEFARILKGDGRLLVAIPAPDDLIELRGSGRDRVERTVESFHSLFELIGQDRATTTADLDVDGVEDILLSIYRPIKNEPARAMRVTFSLDLVLFRRR